MLKSRLVLFIFKVNIFYVHTEARIGLGLSSKLKPLKRVTSELYFDRQFVLRNKIFFYVKSLRRWNLQEYVPKNVLFDLPNVKLQVEDIFFRKRVVENGGFFA